MARVRGTTDAEFFCEHLPYELKMLRATRALIGPWPEPLSMIQNAMLEACALHARNLTEFFRNDGACHFRVTAFVGADYPLNTEFIPKPLRDKVGGQIAHLTKLRTGISQHKLSSRDLAVIEGLIESAVRVFASHLLPPYAEMMTSCGHWVELRDWTA